MDLIRAGLGISKTIRNVGRLQEIVLVFARHGFDEFITSNVKSKVPNLVLPKSQTKITEELANMIDEYMKKSKQGYRSRAEFISEAIRLRLGLLKTKKK